MDTTKLNETKAMMYQKTQSNGRPAFVVCLSALDCTFAKKADAKAFKSLYDKATKH